MDVVDVGKPRQIRVRSLQRAVNGVVGKEQKERLLPMPPDEVAGFAGEGISEMLLLIDRLTPAPSGLSAS